MKFGRFCGVQATMLVAVITLATACGAAPKTSNVVPATAPTGDFSYEPFASTLLEHVDIYDMVD